MNSIQPEPLRKSRKQDIEARLALLETAPTGESFSPGEFWLLSLIGCVLPSLLLVWGWL
jgi:uncharacterized OsmC-like protein